MAYLGALSAGCKHGSSAHTVQAPALCSSGKATLPNAPTGRTNFSVRARGRPTVSDAVNSSAVCAGAHTHTTRDPAQHRSVPSKSLKVLLHVLLRTVPRLPLRFWQRQ